jgi:hypothetical protein
MIPLFCTSHHESDDGVYPHPLPPPPSLGNNRFAFSSEAKFTYDLSPIAVSYSKKHRAWYDYFTSVMAIIGGTFTVVGMMESGIHTVTSKKRR